MRESEVVVGGYYEAKVNNQLVTVRLDEVRQVWSKATGQYLKRFDVTNMKTGRKTHFKSAAKLRLDVTAEYAKRRENERLVAEKVKDINSRLTKVPLGVKGTIADRLASVEAEHRSDPTTTGALSAAARTNATVAQSSSEKATLSNPATEDKQRSDPISASGVAIMPSAAIVTADHTTLNRPTIGLASQLSAVPAGMVGLSNGDASPHLIILARAGTGKTTTAIEGVKDWKGYGTSISPSTQQRAVWDALKMSPTTASVCMVAFNKSIATELQSRVPPGVQAMTMHSMGFKAVQGALGRQQPNGYILDEYTADILGMDVWDAKKNKGAVLSAVSDLVSKCKVNLLNPTTEALDEMVDYYEIELNGSRREVFDLVPQVLERCRNPKGKITFDDMIWLPIVLNLPVAKFDVLIVDEAQDLNKCQQVLAKRAGSRLVFIGDDKQCLLPGTKITMEGGGLVEIEKVVEKPAYIKKLHGYRVCAFNPNMGAFVGRRSQGRQIQKTHVEEYSGDIITISLESKSVECTPNHRWWCRFSTNCDKKFCLYMMERSGQFRLGICQMKYSCGMGIAARARSEKAEKSWMLQIFDTLTEARLAEELASVEFGLPQLVFEHRGKTSPDQEFINAFYSEIGCNRERANRCLDYFGRKYDYPLWEAVTTDRSNYLSTMKGFVVHACNLITGCFDFKVDDSTPSGVWQTGTISRREYIGKVYGITVEPTERGLRLYLANGIVSHNSIYGFAGADCQSIHRLTEELKMTDRGCEVLPLTVTRRCGKAIVAEAQKIVPDFEAYESNPEGKVYYAKYPYRTEE